MPRPSQTFVCPGRPNSEENSSEECSFERFSGDCMRGEFLSSCNRHRFRFPETPEDTRDREPLSRPTDALPTRSDLDPTPPDGGESPVRGFHPSTPLEPRFLYPNLNAPPMHPCARGQGASVAQHVDGCTQQREDEHAHGWILVEVDVPCPGTLRV